MLTIKRDGAHKAELPGETADDLDALEAEYQEASEEHRRLLTVANQIMRGDGDEERQWKRDHGSRSDFPMLQIHRQAEADEAAQRARDHRERLLSRLNALKWERDRAAAAVPHNPEATGIARQEERRLARLRADLEQLGVQFKER